MGKFSTPQKIAKIQLLQATLIKCLVFSNLCKFCTDCIIVETENLSATRNIGPKFLLVTCLV